jgi:hypothetical protein
MASVDQLGLVVGASGLALSAAIFWLQEKQLNKLKKIGTDTHHTAQKLRADTYARESTEKFFALQKSGKRFKCFFPVFYDQKPLPFIVTGDYHALHILQLLLGPDRLELIPVSEASQSPNAFPIGHVSENRSAEFRLSSTDKREDGGDTIGEIYLCSPQVNLALGKLAPAFKPGREVPKFLDVELPCWFADKNTSDGSPQKTIFIPDNGEELVSPSEEYYRAAKKLDEGVEFVPPTEIQKDYGIVLRLTVGQEKFIVIAGLHQYGTWIAGDFLRDLITNERVASLDALGDADFLAVVFGEFKSKDLSVRRFGVLADLLWMRDQGRWIRRYSTWSLDEVDRVKHPSQRQASYAGL